MIVYTILTLATAVNNFPVRDELLLYVLIIMNASFIDPDHCNYRYLLYKYKFLHPDFYSDIGNIVNKIKVYVNDDYISHTVEELIELWDYVIECSIVSSKFILGELSIYIVFIYL